MKAKLILGLLTVIGFVGERDASAEELSLPATAKSVRKVVSDDHHNAFAAFTKWKGNYWLAFRSVIIRLHKAVTTWHIEPQSSPICGNTRGL